MSRFISFAARSAILLSVTTALLVAPPTYAQQIDGPAQLVSRLIDDETAEDAQVAQLAMRIVMLGQPAIDAVSKALETEKNETAILRLTYVFGALSSPMTPADGTVRLPDAAIDKLIELANTPPHPLIQLNAMFSLSSAGPRAIEAVPAVIKRLGEEEDENARAGIQYWLAHRGEQAIPLLLETLRTTDNERLQGDIALTLQGQALPDDAIAFLIDALAKASRDDTRRQLARVLTRMEPVPQAARPAFVIALSKAEDDMSRMTMAIALNEITGEASQTAGVLAEAVKKTQGRSERMQILQLILDHGTDGVQQWARLAREASDDGFRSDLLRAGPRIYSRGMPKETILTGLITIIQATENEDIEKDAIFGMIRLGPDVRGQIEQLLGQTQDMQLKASLSSALAIMASEEKKAP